MNHNFRPEWSDNFSPESAYKACYICDETLVGLHVLTKHLRMHGEGRFPCPSCGAVSGSGLALHDHMRAHFKDKFVGDINLKKSKKRKKTSVPVRQKFSCPEPECSPSRGRRPLVYPNAKAFAAHMVGVHGKKPYGCDLCGVRYHKKVWVWCGLTPPSMPSSYRPWQ